MELMSILKLSTSAIRNLLTSRINKDDESIIHSLNFLLGQAAILSSRSMYKSYKMLWDSEVKVFSQWGEDGIIDYLLTSLNISKPKFVEFGVGEFKECNSRFTAESRNASVYMVDSNKNLVNSVKKLDLFWKNSLFPVTDFITPESAGEHIINAKNLMGGIDIFSIDLDGNDYWILNKLDLSGVSIVICEYNPIFNEINCTVPRSDNFERFKAHSSGLFFGMSLKASISLMVSKGFTFVGTNRAGNNAFFIKSEMKDQVSIPLPIIDNLKTFLDWRIRESRDASGCLNYLNASQAFKIIESLTVIDLQSCEQKRLKDF
jgi:hypothetical protein